MSNPFSSLFPTFSVAPSIPLGYGSSLYGIQPFSPNNLIVSSPNVLCTGLTFDGIPLCPQYDQYFPAEKQPTFEFKVETDKSSYRRGESVHITFIIENKEALPVLVRYASAKKFEISIADHEGFQIWSSSYAMRYAAMSISSEFKAQESKSFSVIWDQKDNNGTLVPPGNYTVKAEWTSNYRGSTFTEIILTTPYIIEELYGAFSDVTIPCFKENEHMVINVEKFKKIRQFIIDQGQRETYCQMYNNNPYYQFSDNFAFYLNPRSQLVDMYDAPVDEFIEITIQEMPAPLKYYYIHYDEAAQNICVRSSPQEEIEEVEKKIDFFFTEALSLIDNK
ncbi:MAG: BsuPI-related putative proteinase inhibitor [bacterium]